MSPQIEQNAVQNLGVDQATIEIMYLFFPKTMPQTEEANKLGIEYLEEVNKFSKKFDWASGITNNWFKGISLAFLSFQAISSFVSKGPDLFNALKNVRKISQERG